MSYSFQDLANYSSYFLEGSIERLTNDLANEINPSCVFENDNLNSPQKPKRASRICSKLLVAVIRYSDCVSAGLQCTDEPTKFANSAHQAVLNFGPQTQCNTNINQYRSDQIFPHQMVCIKKIIVVSA